MKNVVLLGATGSIGSSTLNVLRQNKETVYVKGDCLKSEFRYRFRDYS